MNICYAALLITYWSSCATIHGFAALMLQKRGFASGQIGMILACSYLIAALLQPLVGAWIDRMERFSLPQITMFLGVFDFMSVAGLMLSETSAVATVCTMFLNFAAIYMLQPVTNSIAVFYQSAGRPLNFGIARGLGSLSYALSSSLSGIILDCWPGNGVLYFSLGNLFLLIVAAFILEKKVKMSDGTNSVKKERASEEKNRSAGVRYFVVTYKSYTVVLVGIAALCIFHNMLEGYLYLIMGSLGGNASDTGAALGVAAICELPPLFLIGRIRKKMPSRRLMQIAAIGFTVKAIGIFLAVNVTQVTLVMCLQAVGYGLYTAASVYFVSEWIPMEHQLTGQALMTSAFTAGGVAGSLLGGVLIHQIGVRGMLAVGTGISLAGTGIVLGGAAKGISARGVRKG